MIIRVLNLPGGSTLQCGMGEISCAVFVYKVSYA